MTTQETDRSLELLRELFASATHDASAAMCRWTNGLITISLDEVRRTSLENAAAELEIGDELLTMVVLSIDGGLGGSLILAFDATSGRQLAASLLERNVDWASPWSEFEKSALAETGNILGCAYVNALTRLVGRQLMPSPPCFIQDYGAAVLQQALMAQAMCADDLLVCQIRFDRKDEELDWRVVFVPSKAMQEVLEQSLRVAL